METERQVNSLRVCKKKYYKYDHVYAR